MECVHMLLLDYLLGVCQHNLYNTKYNMQYIAYIVFVLGEKLSSFLDCRFHHIFLFGMAVSCGQWNNRP